MGKNSGSSKKGVDPLRKIEEKRIRKNRSPLTKLIDKLRPPPFELVEDVIPCLNLGDLVEFNRGSHRHRAVYVGNGEVLDVNVTKAKGSSATLLPTNAIIKRKSLAEACDGSKVRIRNEDAFAWEKYQVEPKPPAEIVERCLVLEGKKIEYRLWLKNCEHFANEMRYGVGFSTQATTVRDIVLTVILGALGLLTFKTVAGKSKN